MKGESIDKTVSLLACGLCQAASYIRETNINKNTSPAHNAGGMKRKIDGTARGGYAQVSTSLRGAMLSGLAYDVSGIGILPYRC